MRNVLLAIMVLASGVGLIVDFGDAKTSLSPVLGAFAGLLPIVGLIIGSPAAFWLVMAGWRWYAPRRSSVRFKALVPLMETCRDGLSNVEGSGIKDKSIEMSQVDELNGILLRRWKIWWPFNKGEDVAPPASQYYKRCLLLLQYAREGDVKGAQRQWPKPQAPDTGQP